MQIQKINSAIAVGKNNHVNNQKQNFLSNDINFGMNFAFVADTERGLKSFDNMPLMEDFIAKSPEFFGKYTPQILKKLNELKDIGKNIKVFIYQSTIKDKFADNAMDFDNVRYIPTVAYKSSDTGKVIDSHATKAEFSFDPSFNPHSTTSHYYFDDSNLFKMAVNEYPPKQVISILNEFTPEKVAEMEKLAADSVEASIK